MLNKLLIKKAYEKSSTHMKISCFHKFISKHYIMIYMKKL